MSFIATIKTTVRLASALALSAGCAGGQTGESGGDGPEMPICEDVMRVSLDDELQGGFTPREVLNLFREKQVPAFVFPSSIDDTDRLLAPEDATSTTSVRIDFESDGDITVPKPGCLGQPEIRGTFVVSALDGTAILDGAGVIKGTPKQASLRAGDEGTDVCHGGRSTLFVDSTDGVLTGQLCYDSQLARFPTACGGFAQVPLDEVAAKELPLPSEVLERLGELELEVVWGEADRTPLALGLSAGELACYTTRDYDDHNERTARTWGVPIEVDIAVPDAAIAVQVSTMLSGGPSYEWEEIGALLSSCGSLSEDALDALAPRLESPLRSGRACLDIEAFEGGRLEIKLTVSGEAIDGIVDDEDMPLDVMEVWEVRDVAQ